jgi:hypothetical protein
MTRVRSKRGLYLRRQCVEAAAHIRHACGQPDPGARSRGDHAVWRSARRTLHKVASSTAPRKRSWAPAISSSMTPTRMVLAAAGAVVSRCEAGRPSDSSTSEAMFTGSKTVGVEPNAIDARCRSRRHLNNRLALMPLSSAMAATEAPGCILCSTSLALNAVIGDLLFLGGSALAVMNLVLIQKHQIAPLTAAAIVAVYSGVVTAPYLLLHSSGLKIADAPLKELAIQVIYEGFFVGAGSVLLIRFAVSRIGSQRFSTMRLYSRPWCFLRKV